MDILDVNESIANTFCNKFIELSKANSCLLLQHSQLYVFNEIKVNKSDVKLDILLMRDQMPEKGQWDIVFGDFPFMYKKTVWGPEKSPHRSWNEIDSYGLSATLKSLTYLSPDGYGIFSLEPNVLFSQKNSIRKHLEPIGFSIVAIFNTPEHFWAPYTSLRTPFIVIKKSKPNKEFFGELTTAEQTKTLVDNFFNETVGNNLSTGIWVTPDTFPGFNTWKIQQRIGELESEYKNFEKRSLKSIVSKINLCKTGQSFEHVPNSVYLPKIGTQSATSDLSKTVIKHQNYFQIVCNPEVVDAGYLASFFNSKLGKLIIDTLPHGSVIPSINKESILQTEIALPDLETQKEIYKTISKLAQVKEKITSFENELTVSPVSSKHTISQIDSILEIVGELADSDKIKSIVKSGETKEVEFKETLSLDVRRQIKNTDMETEVVKTVAAFMNSYGGELLVGVSDAGKVVGVDKEIDMFHKSKDRFSIHLKNLIKTRIGEQFYDFIDQKLVDVDGNTVLYIPCKPSPKAVFVDGGKDFYVRTNPATDKLEGEKMLDYIKNHFKQ